ncbi:MAG: DegT/DnrJ/EryC1/StrS family aminotransferase [TACK group archaeon]|nr:DegT/DnrJ/EryC1/StrS family aminotransferase [TACK group archaeon]
MESDKPAILGGKPVRSRPLPHGAYIDEEDIRAVTEVLRSGKLSSLSNPIVEEFEKAFAEYVGTKYAIAVNSGTAALHTALQAMGVGPGDEVVVPPYTFVSTATSVIHANAIPVFADVELSSYNLDADSFEKSITQRTKAVIPVHLFGRPAEMDAIMEVARRHNVMVLEDAAQAHGATYKGKKVGTFGNAAIFSFYESKNMTTGEGGMIVTDDEKIAQRARLIRQHGEPSWYYYVELGYNYRMPAMEAALGLSQLKKLDKFNSIRQSNASYYNSKLSRIKGIVVPKAPDYVKHVYHVYAPRFLEEELGISPNLISKALAAEGINLRPIYPRALYLDPLFQEKRVRPKGCPYSCPYYGIVRDYPPGLCPNVEKLTKEVFSLPVSPLVTKEDIDDIVAAVNKVLAWKDELAKIGA